MKLQLVDKTNLTDDVWSFRFRSTSNELPTFIAGQYVEVDVPHHDPDDQGTKRYFTNSAAPYENVFQITTRISDSSFKQALIALNSDNEITLSDGPYGDFTWNEANARPKVFVAGGIGITPFYSMLKERAHERAPIAATLIYTGRSKDSLPFINELAALEKEFPEFNVSYLIGEQLSTATLQRLVDDLPEALIYLSGAEDMVESLGEDLKKDLSLDDEQLVQDFFPGYDDTTY